MPNDPRIVVVGSSGFIGRRLCEFFASRNVQVVGVCRINFESGNTSYPVLEVGDFGSFLGWRDVLRPEDLVLFVGDRSSYSFHERFFALWGNPSQVALASNIVRRILVACEQVSGVRFVYFSTANLYDRRKSLLDPPVVEREHLVVKGLYCRVKRACEEAVIEVNSLEAMIVRLPVVYGTGVNNSMSRLFKLARSSIPVPYLLVSERPISTLYLENLCEAVEHVYRKREIVRQVYHIADPEPLNLAQIWRLLKGGKRSSSDHRVFSLSRSSRINVGRLLDDSSFKNDYNWHSGTSASDGIMAVFRCSPTIMNQSASKKHEKLIRFLDLVFSCCGLFFLSPILILVTLIASFTGQVFFVQERVGEDENVFALYKFRSMMRGTENVPTHLVRLSRVTTFGRFLRKTKIDELPQLLNVIKGDMSLVGARPCLPSQRELITERRSRGVFMLKPGVTGLAQMRGIDMSNPKRLARVDEIMTQRMSIPLYLRVLFGTVFGKWQ